MLLGGSIFRYSYPEQARILLTARVIANTTRRTLAGTTRNMEESLQNDFVNPQIMQLGNINTVWTNDTWAISIK